MKKRWYDVNIMLVLIVGGICLVGLLVQTFIPAVIRPRVTIPLLVLLSLIPLAVEYYAEPVTKAAWIPQTLLAGLTFSILPWCAGLSMGMPFWKLFLAGTIVFGVTAVLYRAIGRRMTSGPKAGIAPVIQAFGLYLASQCLQGLL